MSRFSPGGFIQLPFPDDTYTWEEYKAKYGVDLEQLFEPFKNGDDEYGVRFKLGVNKPILIYGYEEVQPAGYLGLPNCVMFNFAEIETDPDITLGYLTIAYNDQNNGYGVRLYADKKITAYEM